MTKQKQDIILMKRSQVKSTTCDNVMLVCIVLCSRSNKSALLMETLVCISSVLFTFIEMNTTTKGRLKSSYLFSALKSCIFLLLVLIKSVSVSTKRGRGKSIHRRKTEKKTKLLTNLLKDKSHLNKCLRQRKRSRPRKK